MTDRAFRFGAIAIPQSGTQWRTTARLAEELGYSTLLSPDGMHVPSPIPSLAIAATATTRLRVGTFVLASPLRPPRLAAWDAHSVSELLDGRFELGIGSGRPETIDQAVELLDQPVTSATQRLDRARQTIEHLRELDGNRHTPVMVAASGKKARALAAANADIAILTRGPFASRHEIQQMTLDLRTAAGERADKIELAQTIFVVGNQIPPWMQRFGAGPATMAERESLNWLQGSTSQMVDELLLRRETLGVSYITVHAEFIEHFAPVIERLSGQ